MLAKKLKKLVVVYVRKSRLKDVDAIEIDRQIELLTDYANSNNMEYVIFSEEGSSEDWNRPKLKEMLRELERGIYDGVLVTDQDRLTRDRTDFGLFVRFMKAKSLMLFTLNKTYNFLNDDDIFYTGIQSEMDNHFMRMTKRKLLRGRIQSVKKGTFFSIAPIGYEKDEFTKKLVPNEKRAAVVRSIYDLYVNKGYNQTEICEHLNLLGYTTNEGKPFTTRSTSIILRNVAYIGIVRYELENEEPIHVIDAHPALIDEDTFNKAQLNLAQNRKVPQTCQRGVYSLSRLLVCPKCNQTLSFCMKYNKRSARKSLIKDERELYVLNCFASKSTKGKRETAVKCTNYGVKASRVEAAIFAQLKLKLDMIDNEIETIIRGDNSYINEVEQKQMSLSNRLSALDEQKKRVQNGYKNGIYNDEEAAEEIESIRRQQGTIKQELKTLEGATVKAEVDRIQETKEKIEHLLSRDTSNQTKTNKLLSEVIDKVYYWKEKNDVGGEKPFEILIEYN